MSFYDAIRVGAAGASTGHEVERSIRLSRSDNAKFSKTFSSDGNRRKWTFSVWAKFPDPIDSNTNQIFSYQQGHVNHRGSFYKGSSGVLNYQLRVGGSRKAFVTTDAQLRDPSAWYHIVLVIDSDQGSSTNRVKIYVNGVQQSVVYHDTPTSGFDTWINSTQTLYLGAAADENGGNMYLAEINFIDGQAYDPSYFGETNSLTGQWVPIEYTGSYTGNSFYLKFDDNSNTTATTLGKDSSGLGNNWTPNNFSVAAGDGNDSVEDTPTNNFCTLNPLDKASTISLKNGALQIDDVTNQNYDGIRGTFGVKTGKYYWEIKFPTTGYLSAIGIARADGRIDTSNQPTYRIVLGLGSWYNTYNSGGVATYVNATPSGDYPSVATWSGASNYSNNDIYMIAVDFDTGKIWWGKNNSWFNNSGTANPSTGTDPRITFTTGNEWFPYSQEGDSSTSPQAYNFGQQGFAYTPPTGFEALNSENLPDPTILLPTNEFDTKLWTGNGGTQTITGLNFSPDFVWIKIRTQAYNHVLWDTLRGATLRLQANKTNADGTNTNGLTAFNSDGYDLGDMNNINKSGDTFVGWNWDAGETDSATYTVKVVSDSGNKYRFNDFGTSAVTLDLAEGGTYTFDQSDSSMSSHPMQLSTTANGTHGGGSAYSTGVTYELDGSTVTASAFISGFSSASSRKLIITVAASAPTLYYYCYYHSGMGGAVNTNSTLGSSNFDGTIQATVKANATAGFSIVKYTGTGSTATIGHGLGVAPEFMFVKSRDSADHWALYHHKIGNTKVVYMDIINAPATSSAYWNDTSPTSSVFTVGSDNKTNKSGDDFVAYCYSGVSQYSKFGEYTGNGLSDGTFIHLGFRPAFFMFRQVTYSDNWYMYDNKRDTFNPTDQELNPSNSQSEASSHDIDFVSNGVKMRTNNSSWNYAGYNYIYLAFAELPFKNSRAR